MNKAEMQMLKPAVRVRPSELAAALHVSRQAVSKALAAPGAPVPGPDGKLDLEKALAWYATRGARSQKVVAAYRDAIERGDIGRGAGGPAAAEAGIPPIEISRRRQAWADAQAAEIALAKERGLLVEKVEVERIGARDGGIVRDGLLALPAEVAPALADAAAQGGASAVERLLDAEVRRLLSAWASAWKTMKAEGVE